MMQSYRRYYLLWRAFPFVWLFLIPAPVVWGAVAESATHPEPSLFDYLKGTPTEDQLFVGMFTYHFNAKSLRTRNWSQNLVGFQYHDIFVCTFENSFYNRTWAAGLARNLSTKSLSNQWDIHTGYRLGAAYGYKEGEAPFSSISPIIPVAEVYLQSLYQHHYGIELMLTSSLSLSFFYQF